MEANGNQTCQNLNSKLLYKDKMYMLLNKHNIFQILLEHGATAYLKIWYLGNEQCIFYLCICLLNDAASSTQ
jgi:hypothetical protein